MGIDLLVLAAVVAGLAAVVVLGSTHLLRSRRRALDRRLPQGADAALWSIVEAMPDPRNHLALTRDMTGEVRVARSASDHSLAEVLAGSPGHTVPLRSRH